MLNKSLEVHLEELKVKILILIVYDFSPGQNVFKLNFANRFLCIMAASEWLSFFEKVKI